MHLEIEDAPSKEDNTRMHLLIEAAPSKEFTESVSDDKLKLNE